MNEVINNPFSTDDFDASNTIRRTYRMDFKNKRIAGFVDGLEAAKQGIAKAIMTKRFAHQIYDDQYGCDILNKVGSSSLTKEYLDSDIPAMIEDTFLTDDAITGVSNVRYNMADRDSVEIYAEIQTIYGNVDLEEVIYDE